MLFKEDVYMWFKHSEPHRRLEFVCGILNMCVPLELKFIRTFVDNLGHRDDTLKDAEAKCNQLNGLSQVGKVLDERTRSKLILYLALLEARNQTCSKILYDALISSLTSCENDQYLATISHRDKNCYNNQMRLIFTLMIHHPAFKYEEVKLASEKLTVLDNSEESTSSCWHNDDNAMKIGDNQSTHINNLPNERNQVMEACDSGLSIGTEPEGEILSDHSCFPNQCDHSFPLSLRSTLMPPDKIEENKRKNHLWQAPCPIPPGPVANTTMQCKTSAVATEPVKSIAQHDVNMPPTPGAVNSSSGDSLNMAEILSVPTAYIYNSSICERTALEAPPPYPIVKKKEVPNSQKHDPSSVTKPTGTKPLWFGSVSNASSVSAHSSPLPSGQGSSQKMATSIVTTSPQSSCHESSLCSTVITSVVVCRTMTRPAPLPRQMSNSSSSSSHPSSPAMISGPKTSRYPGPPTNHRLAGKKPSQQQQNHIPQSVNKDELSSIISGPLSDTISFIPSMEDCIPVSTSQQNVTVSDTNGHPADFQFLAQSSANNSETSITTTLTTTLAVSSTTQAPGKSSDGNQVSVSSNSIPGSNQCKHIKNNETDKRSRRVEPVTGPCQTTMTTSSSHTGPIPTLKSVGPVISSSQAQFLTSPASSRMPAYTFYPPNVGPMPKPNSSFYYASKGNHSARLNGKGPGPHRRNCRTEPPDGKHTQKEHSTSSSQYSSPSQTPSPDIKKSDKSEVPDSISEIVEPGMNNGFSMQGANLYTDNTSPPPIYNQYAMHTGHPRHRYMSFPQQQMGFIPYPHPHGMYRYPIPNHHMVMGARPPPPLPTSTDKSSREATPPSVNISTLESAVVKPEVSPPPSASSAGHVNRKSASASPPGYVQDGPVAMPPAPPNHIGHGPLPYNGPNYQMIPGPFFTPVPGFMPGHASLGNGYVSQIPPNFSLPPMTEIMYQSPPYALMGGGSTGGPPFQAAMMSGKPTRSMTCCNCGQGGHTGSDCNESSMVELTKCT